MINKFKKILRWFGVIFIIISIVSIAILFNWLKSHKNIPPKQERAIPEKVYRPPIVKIPFVKSKQPIEDKNLPIPKKDISKSIVVDLPKKGESKSEKVTLVISKKGHVYPTKDMPKNVKIRVTTWKPKVFAIDGRFGASILFDGKNLNYALSLDFFRITKVFLGCDIGFTASSYTFNLGLVGLSGRYSWMKSGHSLLLISGGYNFLNNHPYIGVTYKW